MAVSHWDWSKSNGTATVAKTIATYNALTTGGLTAAFSASVWNDILAKISSQRIAWGDTSWNNKIAKLADSKMSAGKQMTAVKFNSAVLNIPISNYVWPWEEKLGRSEILKGDRCYGMYFIHLTDGINHWIDLVPLPIDVVAAFHTLNQADIDTLKALHVLPARPVSHSVLGSVSMTGNATLSARQLLDLAFDLDVSFKSEPWIKEVCADPFRAVLDIPTQTEARISYNDTCAIDALLDIIVSKYVKVRPAPAEHVSAAARFLTPIDARLHIDRAQGVRATLLQSSMLLSQLTTQRVLPFAVFDLSNFNFSTGITIRPGFNTAGFAQCRHDVSATISELEGVHTGTALNMRILVGATADVFKSPHTGSLLQDRFDTQIDVIVCQGAASGAKLYDQFHTYGKSFLTHPAYFSMEFSYETEQDAKAAAVERMRQVKADKDFSYTQLGHILGIDKVQIHRYVNGQVFPSFPRALFIIERLKEVQ